MNAQSMSPRERWLAALRMQPVDQLPFWPKLDSAYIQAQARPFREMDLETINDWIGSDKHLWFEGFVEEVRRSTKLEVVVDGNTRRTLYRTRHGELELIEHFDVASQAWYPIKHPISTLDDIHLMREFYEDAVVEVDAEALQEVTETVRRIGGSAATSIGIGESPLMHFVEWLAGVETSHYLLADHTQEVEALFKVMHQVLLRKAEILADKGPVDFFMMVENTSTTLISPKQYLEYCYKHITDYGNICRGYERILVLHMCGHLKALLPDLATLPVAGFEAFTSPSLGNTTLGDGRTACPDKCLIGGTNATLWTRPAEEIIAQLECDLDVLPHHRGIIPSSAGLMPPACKPETIKTACEWVHSYPARM